MSKERVSVVRNVTDGERPDTTVDVSYQLYRLQCHLQLLSDLCGGRTVQLDVDGEVLAVVMEDLAQRCRQANDALPALLAGAIGAQQAHAQGRR